MHFSDEYSRDSDSNKENIRPLWQPYGSGGFGDGILPSNPPRDSDSNKENIRPLWQPDHYGILPSNPQQFYPARRCLMPAFDECERQSICSNKEQMDQDQNSPKKNLKRGGSRFDLGDSCPAKRMKLENDGTATQWHSYNNYWLSLPTQNLWQESPDGLMYQNWLVFPSASNYSSY